MPPRASVGFLENEGTYVTKQSQTDWIYANCAECNVRKNTRYRQKQSKQFFIALGSILTLLNVVTVDGLLLTIMDYFFFFLAFDEIRNALAYLATTKQKR